jgi:hypothetical protein
MTHPQCDRCGEGHAMPVAGRQYRIAAEDCCLEVVDLVGTVVGWEPSPDGTVLCDVLRFAEGFALGPSWASTGWTFTPIEETRNA